MLKCDDRFARQNRDGPPPEFPLASPSSSIVHHLSGPIGRAPTRTANAVGRRRTPTSTSDGGSRLVHFHCASCSRRSRGLARTLDSLVRVSRRVRCGPRGWTPSESASGIDRPHSSPQRGVANAFVPAEAGSPFLGRRRGRARRGRSSADAATHRSTSDRAGDSGDARVSSDGQWGGPHGLGSARFHALLNSLFKVLFIFPSRYLFAIGLAPVFVEPWMESTTRFGLQSQTTRLSDSDPSGGGRRVAHGVVTLSDAPFQETWTRRFGRPPHRAASSVYKSHDGACDFNRGPLPASLAVTEGILVSFSSSA